MTQALRGGLSRRTPYRSQRPRHRVGGRSIVRPARSERYATDRLQNRSPHRRPPSPACPRHAAGVARRGDLPGSVPRRRSAPRATSAGGGNTTTARPAAISISGTCASVNGMSSVCRAPARRISSRSPAPKFCTATISPMRLPSRIDGRQPDQIGVVELALGCRRQPVAIDVELDALQRLRRGAVRDALEPRHHALGRRARALDLERARARLVGRAAHRPPMFSGGSVKAWMITSPRMPCAPAMRPRRMRFGRHARGHRADRLQSSSAQRHPGHARE